MPTEFRNEPFTDFSKEENAQAMRNALEKVKRELGREYPLVIGGERITTESKLDSFNPANRTELVGRFSSLQPKDIELGAGRDDDLVGGSGGKEVGQVEVRGINNYLFTGVPQPQDGRTKLLDRC
jgi:hypothetical protein